MTSLAIAQAAATEPQSVKEEWRRGWSTVASAFIGNGLGFNLFLMSAGLFVIPLQEELGLPRMAVMITTVAMLLVSLLSPAAALYLDKHGPRKPALFGYLLLALAFLLLAVLPASVTVYYGVTCLFVAAGTITGTMVFCKGVSLIFRKGAGLAFGIAMSGVSLISAVVIPLLSAAIAAYGWRGGYAACGLLVAFIGLPILLIAFRPPVQVEPRLPTGNAGQDSPLHAAKVVRTTRFWLLAATISCGTFCIGGMVAHLYPMLLDAGISAPFAAAVMSTYAISIGAGRIITGFLLDRAPPTRIAAGCMTAAAIGAGVLLLALKGQVPIEMTFLAAFLLGWGQGAEGDFPAFFTLKLFGHDTFAKIFSWINIFGGGSMALGGLAFAVVFDTTNSYLLVVILTGLLWLSGATLMLALSRHDQPGRVFAH